MRRMRRCQGTANEAAAGRLGSRQRGSRVTTTIRTCRTPAERPDSQRACSSTSGRTPRSRLWLRDPVPRPHRIGRPGRLRGPTCGARDRRCRPFPASPLMHSTGFIFASLPTLTAGGTVTTLESRSFDAHELLATVEATDADDVVAIVGDAFALPIVRALDGGPPDGGTYQTRSLASDLFGRRRVECADQGASPRSPPQRDPDRRVRVDGGGHLRHPRGSVVASQPRPRTSIRLPV